MADAASLGQAPAASSASASQATTQQQQQRDAMDHDNDRHRRREEMLKVQRDAPRRSHGEVPEAVKEIEKSISQLGIEEYDDSVVLQLLDAYQDHLQQVKSKAEALAVHSDRNEVLDYDVNMAAMMQRKSSRANIPPTSNKDLRCLAEKVNHAPLDFGDPTRVQLPPRSQRGVGVNMNDAAAVASRRARSSDEPDSTMSQEEEQRKGQEEDPFAMLRSAYTTEAPTSTQGSGSEVTSSQSTAQASTTAESETISTTGSAVAASAPTSSISSLAPLQFRTLHRKKDEPKSNEF